MWVFEDDVLEESLSQLWSIMKEWYPDNSREALGDFPSLSIDELPYRSADGMMLLLITTLRLLNLVYPLDQQYLFTNKLTPGDRVGIS